MSKFPGGIFSKARGKTSGIVFSAARTRQGKLMTSRALVIPANPQTAPQQENRRVFDLVQRQVRLAGTGIYRNDFNRGVEDLPGYQSLISLLRRTFNLAADGVTWSAQNTPPVVLRGDLHFPGTYNVDLASESITWSTELGTNGANDDEVVAVTFGGRLEDEEPPADVAVANVYTADRSAGSITADDSHLGQNANAVVFLWVRNLGNESPERYSVITPELDSFT